MTIDGEMRFLKPFAVTIYGLVILAVIAVGSSMHIEYDGGLHGLLFHFFVIPVLGFMYYLPHELMFSAGGGQAIPHQEFFATVAGLLICAAIDYIRYRLLKNRRQRVKDQRGLAMRAVGDHARLAPEGSCRL